MVMARRDNLNSIQSRHHETSHRSGILVPFSLILVVASWQLIYAGYVRTLSYTGQLGYALCIVIMAFVTLLEILRPRLGKQWKFIEYSLLHLLVFLAFLYVLPPGTAYTTFIILFGMLLFYDYGLKVAAVSISVLLSGMIARYIATVGIADHNAFSEYVVLCLAVGILTQYATSIMQLSKRELQDIETINKKVIANEQQVQSLINNITDGVLAIDQSNKIVMYNAAALDVLDLNTAVVGKKIDAVFKPLDAESQAVDVHKLLEGITTPTINRDLRLRYSDGSIANIFVGIAPIYLGYGKSANNGFTLILRDITREKSLEEERDEFISVVSHELRTPIAITEGSISNAQFIVEKTGDIDTIRKTLKESHNQVIFLADMINDLSTLSRAERGVLEVEVATININDLVQELASNYSMQADAKKLALKTDVAADIGELQSSKLYVREILQNFITNSIKYTEAGSVTIKATPADKGVYFEVIDTGIGISKSDQNKVFDKFFRSEDFRTRANNGTGLGLYVTMKLVRLIHAEIDVTSELNKGSTFKIFIPNLK